MWVSTKAETTLLPFSTLFSKAHGRAQQPSHNPALKKGQATRKKTTQVVGGRLVALNDADLVASECTAVTYSEEDRPLLTLPTAGLWMARPDTALPIQ